MKRGAYLAAIVMLKIPSAAFGCRDLEFSDPWVREPPPVAAVAAAYVEITNRSSESITVENVSSPCCGSVMMHDVEIIDGVNRMRHLHHIEIPAGDTFVLRPLGPHLMLMGLKEVPLSATRIEITFECSAGDPASIDFVSRRGPESQ